MNRTQVEGLCQAGWLQSHQAHSQHAASGPNTGLLCVMCAVCVFVFVFVVVFVFVCMCSCRTARMRMRMQIGPMRQPPPLSAQQSSMPSKLSSGIAMRCAECSYPPACRQRQVEQRSRCRLTGSSSRIMRHNPEIEASTMYAASPDLRPARQLQQDSVTACDASHAPPPGARTSARPWRLTAAIITAAWRAQQRVCRPALSN